MIDNIVRVFARPEKATLEPQKAVTGPGASVMSWGTPINDVSRTAHQMMREAQAVYSRGNRWVKRAEQVISGRVGSVPWHLEIDGETINDESPEELQAIMRLFEMPLGTDQLARQYPGQPRTRREQWGLTSRHMGLCNVGFWFLDEINGIGWPQRIFFVRPDRLTPKDTVGTLAGWTLDKDTQNERDLLPEEVLPFYLDPPDKGFFGTGNVESIFTTIPLPSAIDRHAIDTLSSGGRLPGIYAPKEGAQGDEVFERLQNDLRTIKDMPDSSKRDVVARAPIEFTPTAADMGSLVVTALSQTSRDDTLAHWGVPLSTIGGYTPSGLNSGESRKYDEAALWQNAVQFRIDSMYETIQYRLLDRLGMGIQLIIESPTFDDDAPKFAIAKSAEALPLTNAERRALVGYDPLGDPALDNAVVMPVNMVTFGTAPDSGDETGPAKASLDKTLDVVRNASVSRLSRDVAKVLSDMGKEIAAAVRAKGDQVTKKPGDFTTWLPNSKRTEFEAALQKALAPHLSLAAETVGERVEATLGRTGKADPLFGKNVLAKMMKSVGLRIAGIMDTTRDQVRDEIERGIRDGVGAAELGDRIEDATTFSELRAETIARTETAHVLNEAALESYREFNVDRVVAIDGDDDPECAARDGQEYDLDDALSISDHPNGTLDWAPVLNPGKAVMETPVPEPPQPIATMSLPQITIPLTVQMPEQPVTVNVPQQPAPIVNVAAAEIPATVINMPEQPAPIVNFTAPEPAQKAQADGPMDVRVVDMPDRMLTSRKIVKRDAKGLITEVDEKSVEETA